MPALLAYLAVTRRPHQREALASVFWSEMPDAASANNLRQALTNLRRIADSHLVITRETVSFHLTQPYFLDSEAFTHGMHAPNNAPPAQRARHLRQTLAYYDGEFLKGFHVRDAPEFEDWVLAQRVHLRELALHGWDELTSLLLALGDAGGAIDAASCLLAMDPWREEAHRQRMLALARSGQYSAALAQYQTCRSILAAEFDDPPSWETTALYERIRDARRGPRHNLPATTTGFVGREREQTELRAMLVSPQTRLLTILGPGGVGKTRLILQVAADLETMFLNGVWFVPLAAVPTDRPDALVAALCEALQVPLTHAAEMRKQLLDYLRTRELLLILDNLEQFLGETVWLCELLRHAPDVKIVATSRERLNLQAERIFVVDGLPIPLVGAPVPQEYASVELFVQRAQWVQPRFALTADDAEPVMRICRMVHGLPLGLELAAGWAHQLTCTEIAREIERSLDFLATARRDVSPRQRSLRAVFDWSWGHLTVQEQVVFQRLAVFRGPFTQEAATQVAGATRAILATLVDKSLLHVAGTSYHLPGAVKHFAWEKLDQANATATVQGDHAGYYVGLLVQNADRCRGLDQKRALEEIAPAIENVRAAWQWLVERRDVAGIDAAIDGFYLFTMIRSRFREGWEAFHAARGALQQGNARDVRTQLVLNRAKAREGRFLSSLSQFEAAQTLLQESLAALRQLDAPDEIAFVLGHLGGIARLQGHLESAEAYLQECLALRRQTMDFYGQAIALLELGGVGFVRGDFATARRHCQDGLAIEQAAGDLQTVAHLLTGLSLCYRELGQFAEAQGCVRRSLQNYEALSDQYGMLQAYLTLGELSRQLGNPAEAQRYCARAVVVGQEIGDRSGEADGCYRLGQIAIDSGNFDEALHQLQLALSLANEIHETPLLLDILLEIAGLCVNQGDVPRATEILLFLVQQPQLPRQRRQRVSDLLARLDVHGDSAETGFQGSETSLERIVILAGGIPASLTATAPKPAPS